MQRKYSSNGEYIPKYGVGIPTLVKIQFLIITPLIYLTIDRCYCFLRMFHNFFKKYIACPHGIRIYKLAPNGCTSWFRIVLVIG